MNCPKIHQVKSLVTKVELYYATGHQKI